MNPLLKEITTFLNSATGGSETKSGVLDFNPENIEHLIEFIGGGAGKFVSNSVGTGSALIKGEKLQLNKIPIARKVVGEPNEWSDLSVIYTLLPNIARESFSDLEKNIF